MENRKKDTVCLYAADISAMTAEDFDRLYRQASPGRRKRADSCRNRDDAARCLTAEALLRYALDGAEFTVRTAPGGKPHIPELPDFHYSLSHAGDWVVLACGGNEVGVDAERIREDTDVERFARRFFTTREREYLLQSSDGVRCRFFEIWTKKESLGKFLGSGLGDPGKREVFDLPPGVRFFPTEMAERYWLSLCTEGEKWEIRQVDVCVLGKNRL